MPDRVLITGATGLIGTALAASCARDGLPVVALVRPSSMARAAPRLPGATLRPWDAAKGPPTPDVFDGVDVVVNLVGEPIAGRRWSEAHKRRVRETRVLATRALVEGLAAREARPRALIQASGTGFYGDRGDDILTEASSSGTGFLAEICREWEAEAEKARALGVRVVVLRTGVVLARAGGFLAKILPPFRLGVGGHVGTGKQWLPWIHLDDQVALIRHAMATPSVAGVLNAVAPEPVTNAELTTALGRALRRPTVLSAPAFALRLALGGEMAEELVLASQRAMPVRTLEAGFKFQHPLLEPALRDLV
jgi:uncharacterized protein (TIGR01777 family)